MWLPGRAAAVNTAWGSMFDSNGDGRGDLAVGTESHSDTIPPRVFIYQGMGGGLSMSAMTIVAPLSPPNISSIFQLRAAGDVNGDGFADLAVHVLHSTSSEFAYPGG